MTSPQSEIRIPKSAVIIAIGGASRSGKTSLAKKLRRKLREHGSCVVLHQDDYIQPIPDIPLIQDEVDWECPESLDYEKFKALIRQAADKEDFVIVDGFMLYPDAELVAVCDVHLFCEIDKATFWKRRKKDRRYGIDADWYIEHVWASFLKYGQPPDELEVHRTRKAKEALEIVLKFRMQG